MERLPSCMQVSSHPAKKLSFFSTCGSSHSRSSISSNSTSSSCNSARSSRRRHESIVLSAALVLGEENAQRRRLRADKKRRKTVGTLQKRQQQREPRLPPQHIQWKLQQQRKQPQYERHTSRTSFQSEDRMTDVDTASSSNTLGSSRENVHTSLNLTAAATVPSSALLGAAAARPIDRCSICLEYLLPSDAIVSLECNAAENKKKEGGVPVIIQQGTDACRSSSTKPRDTSNVELAVSASAPPAARAVARHNGNVEATLLPSTHAASAGETDEVTAATTSPVPCESQFTCHRFHSVCFREYLIFSLQNVQARGTTGDSKDAKVAAQATPEGASLIRCPLPHCRREVDEYVIRSLLVFDSSDSSVRNKYVEQATAATAREGGTAPPRRVSLSRLAPADVSGRQQRKHQREEYEAAVGVAQKKKEKKKGSLLLSRKRQGTPRSDRVSYSYAEGKVSPTTVSSAAAATAPTAMSQRRRTRVSAAPAKKCFMPTSTTSSSSSSRSSRSAGTALQLRGANDHRECDDATLFEDVEKKRKSSATASVVSSAVEELGSSSDYVSAEEYVEDYFFEDEGNTSATSAVGEETSRKKNDKKSVPESNNVRGKFEDGPALYDMYLSRSFEVYADTAGDILRCVTPGCDYAFWWPLEADGADEELSSGEVCPKCKVTCLICGAPAHAKQTCEEAADPALFAAAATAAEATTRGGGLVGENCAAKRKKARKTRRSLSFWRALRTADLAFKEYKEVNGLRDCQQCGAVLSLDSGCAKMRCRCGFKFCYACGTPSAACKCKEVQGHDFLSLEEVRMQSKPQPKRTTATPSSRNTSATAFPVDARRSSTANTTSAAATAPRSHTPTACTKITATANISNNRNSSRNRTSNSNSFSNRDKNISNRSSNSSNSSSHVGSGSSGAEAAVSVRAGTEREKEHSRNSSGRRIKRVDLQQQQLRRKRRSCSR